MNQSISPRELYGEFLGTFIILIFGNGVVAQTVLSKSANGSYLAINLAWGLGVAMAVYVSAGASGAHLNPAVTLALAARRDFAWNKVIPYFIAQLLGGFAGAAMVFLVYREAFNAFDKGIRVFVIINVTGPFGRNHTVFSFIWIPIVKLVANSPILSF